MLVPKKLQEELQTLMNSPVKDLSDRQSPSINVNATAPIGQTAVKVEVGVGVEDGEVKPKFQAKLEGLLDGLPPTATDGLTSRAQEKRAACSGGYRQGKKARSRSYGAGKHGRGHRGMMAR